MGSVTAHDLSFCIGGLARRMLWRCIAIEAITTDVREVLKRPLYLPPQYPMGFADVSFLPPFLPSHSPPRATRRRFLPRKIRPA